MLVYLDLYLDIVSQKMKFKQFISY